AAIKAEGGFPSIQGVIECDRLFGKEVVISMPIEGDLIPLGQIMKIQLSATSDHEYYGPLIPKVFNHLWNGEYDAATQIYWQLHPARKAKSALAQVLYGGAFINRQAWKFQGWLQGYNGGPLRQPTPRLHQPQTFALRKGLIDAASCRAWIHSGNSSSAAIRSKARWLLTALPPHARSSSECSVFSTATAGQRSFCWRLQNRFWLSAS